MSFSQRLWWCGSSFLFLVMLLPTNVSAQSVKADGTLSTTVTSPDNLNFTITNGNQPNSGGNLFHSFSQFSVPTGGSATFDLVNTPNISTIFSRVTGGSASNIDGLIQTINNNNPVSLFLLNPNGIIFGANASLNIGGSFIGTTANSIKFADGVEFSATNNQASPLLTIASPIGLNMGSNAGAIAVQNTGHRLIDGNVPIQNGTTPVGLQVAIGKTLALIGGDVTLDGGIVNAPSGHIEIGSAKSGTVNLNMTASRWNFDYGNLTEYGNIQFLKQALANASGSPAGSIHFQGKNISINEGSVALLTNQGNQGSGNISINASESLEMRRVGTNGFTQSILTVDTITGGGGDLVITAPRLLLEDGGRINTHTFGSGTAGNISVAVDSIQISGFSALNPATTRSGIMSETRGSGRAGDIQVTAQQLRMQDGGSITGASFGTGSTGNVMVDSSKSIEMKGETPISFSASLIGTVSFNRGNGGNVTINTAKLTVQNGAGISASTLGQGNAGTLRINVSEQISVSGVSAASGKVGTISASASVLPLAFQKAFGLSALPTGNSGDLIINTPILQITDRGEVRVSHQGIGNAGNLFINAGAIALDRAGSISAATNSGEGGQINIRANTLLLRHGSNITATAGGNGNGGNININAPVILGIENSDIIANAVRGSGGNINITTQGLFGLKFRPQLTPENDITASSQFGLSGTVNINNLTFTPIAGLIQLPSDIDDPSQRIAQGCRTYGNSRFIVTGRGGVADNPSDRRSGNHPWTDIRDPVSLRNSNTIATVKQSENATPPIVEATGWQINAKGEVDLYTANSAIREATVTDCAGFLAISPKLFKVKEVMSNEF
ncbi:filamentous hemagglutinin N-terminal domain-containing protein [Pseudanabaena sp. UWO310]|uniref:two-partner secretion domain-containing protein n=1 Tax=Pseudanabaena sp. UWO310 TaxID=2480795 RepID=UPI001CC1E0E6|nr:filamentous hemagglutinin N-terminal domain-containing protein [Pseudanabaena sp. UWO310]